MADNKPLQEQDNKDAQSGEPVQLDKEQQHEQGGRQGSQHEGNQAGGQQQGAERPMPEGGQKR
jgi:hypothetical protein